MNKTFAVMIMCLCLAACGFEPMYGKKQGETLRVDLSPVAVETVRGPLGAQLKTALERGFNPSGVQNAAKQYRLSASIRYDKIPVVIEPDGSINRYNLNLNSDYVLIRSGDGTELKKGRLHKTVSYNAVESDFATFVSEQDIVRRGLEDLAEDYRLLLGAYFRQMKQ